MDRGILIVLDTHAWIWWTDQSKRLSAAARRSVEEASEIGISAISCWELAMLVAKGRLRLDRDVEVWVQQALGLPRVVLVPLSAEIAIAAANLLAQVHGDPADWIIVATALQFNAKLVSRDRRLKSSKRIDVVW